MGVPEFDAIRLELWKDVHHASPEVFAKIDAAEAAYMAKCAEVDRRYLFAGWLQSGHPYYVETTATYEDMDNEVARLHARVAELEDENAGLHDEIGARGNKLGEANARVAELKEEVKSSQRDADEWRKACQQG